MMEEYGKIVELREGRIALVECVRNSACQHCASSAACNLGMDQDSMRVEAWNQIDAGLHDRVKIVTSTGNYLKSSFMLYIVPIIGLLFGGLLGQTIGEQGWLAVDPVLMSALSGVVFLVLTFLLIRRITRGLNRRQYMPQIVQLTSDNSHTAHLVDHGNQDCCHQ